MRRLLPCILAGGLFPLIGLAVSGRLEDTGGKNPAGLQLIDASFEERTNNWSIKEKESSAIYIDSSDAYYGARSITIKNAPGGSGEIAQELAIGKSQSTLAGQALAAGVWIKLDSADGLGPKSVGIRLEVYSNRKYHPHSEAFLPIGSKQQTWLFLRTPAKKPAGKFTRARVVLFSSKPGMVSFDFVQAGAAKYIHGNPEKFVMLAYQPWFGREGGWGCWEFADHDPGQILTDGRRDIAAVDYPIVGVYDSKDRYLLAYHLDLAKAMGIDALQVNYYAGLNQDYIETFETLLDLAEAREMKISVLYEPKIHLNGWIRHDNREEALQAIADDCIEIIDRYGDRKAFLKLNGKPLIACFGVTENGLTSGDWDWILGEIRKAGRDPALMGDRIVPKMPLDEYYACMSAMFHWALYLDRLQEADYGSALAYCRSLNEMPALWAEQKPEERLAVGLVYPGFNDAKIMNWGAGNTRVIKITGRTFYQASWEAVLSGDRQCDWILIATFNDWNEGTNIEPDRDKGHELAIMTQNYIERFKGLSPLDDGLVEQVTEAYLENPAAPKYD